MAVSPEDAECALPNELLAEVFLYVTGKHTISAISRCCKQFREILVTHHPGVKATLWPDGTKRYCAGHWDSWANVYRLVSLGGSTLLCTATRATIGNAHTLRAETYVSRVWGSSLTGYPYLLENGETRVAEMTPENFTVRLEILEWFAVEGPGPTSHEICAEVMAEQLR
jgi:hypothetical protein